MIAVLLVGGLFRSLQFTSVNTIAFADVEPRRMSRATSLASVSQQLSVSTGVTVGALALETVMAVRGDAELTATEFPAAFVVIALISASATVLFALMPKDAGAEMANRPGRKGRLEIVAWMERSDIREQRRENPGSRCARSGLRVLYLFHSAASARFRRPAVCISSWRAIGSQSKPFGHVKAPSFRNTRPK